MNEERVRFAESLMEEAEHSSEIAMRTSLSRAYYAVHHLGIALTGESNHALIRNSLKAVDEQLSIDYGRLLVRRQLSDYNPVLTSFEPEGLARFRETSRDDLISARNLYERLKRRLYEQSPTS